MSIDDIVLESVEASARRHLAHNPALAEAYVQWLKQVDTEPQAYLACMRCGDPITAGRLHPACAEAKRAEELQRYLEWEAEQEAREASGEHPCPCCGEYHDE